MKCEYAREDGSYVLGALAPAERSTYERHLAGCASCRNAVAELAVLPGLLGRLDAATAEQIAADAVGASATGLTRLLTEAARRHLRERRRLRRRRVLSAVAAACAVVLVAVGIAVVRPAVVDVGADSVRMYAMTPVGKPGPFSAEVGLAEVHGGTLVRMHCAYQAVGSEYHIWVYRLVAFGQDGEREQVGTWTAGPGDDLVFDWVTHYPATEVSRIELQKADGSPLLTWAR